MSAMLLAWMYWGPDVRSAVGVFLPVVLGGLTYLLALRVTDPPILMEARRMLFARSS
jgi:hypothetical protein